MRILNNLTIKQRTIFFSAVLVVLGWILFCYLVYEHIEYNKKKSAEINATDTSILIGSLLTPELISDNQKIHTLFKNLSTQLLDITNFSVYDKQTGLKYCSNKDAKSINTEELMKIDNIIYKWDKLALTVIYPLDKIQKKDLSKGSSSDLLLVLSYSGEKLKDSIGKEFFFFKIISAIFSTLFISIIYVFTHLITKPLETFSSVLTKVTLGDTDIKIKDNFRGEYGKLAQNFNLMIDRLNQTQQEMIAYSTNLEEVIMLRTKRLNTLVDEISEQKEFFDKILNTVGAIIIVFDKTKKVIIFNNTAETTLGFSKGDVLGCFLHNLLFFNNNEKNIINMYEKDKGTITFESVINTQLGQEKSIIWQITESIVSVNESFLIVTGLDITEKKKIEKFLIESQRFQSISNLLAGLSHNFNNILVGVLGYAGLVRIKLASELAEEKLEEYTKYLNTIEQSAQRASDLIKNIRSFAKREDYHEEIIHVNDLILEIRDVIQGVFPSSINKEIITDEGLWAIKADPVNIKQAIMNICINAKEAMKDGGTLTIKAVNIDIKHGDNIHLKQGRYVAISISDTGVGIENDKLAMIFEPFFTTQSYITHMGLGLTQSYSIVKHHEGHIEVQSTVGLGSTFTIYLPAIT